MEVNRADIVGEVTEAFERYEAALVANDVPTLCDFFWDSPRAVRYGDRESLYGHAEIAAFRRSQPVGNLARELRRVVITTFGSDLATASVEFRRTPSGDCGRQMQTWARMEDGWRIVAAHVSLLLPPAP
jgi:ketosteroid isomerase-like protein